MIRKHSQRVKKAVCVLASGGIDSSVLVAELARRGKVVPLYLRSGFRWEAAEVHWLKKFLAALPGPLKKNILPLAVLSLPARDLFEKRRHWAIAGNPPGYHSADRDVFLPGRNLLFLSKAATFCALRGIPRLVLGSLGGNPFPDATPAFLKAMQRAARLALGGLLVLSAPYRGLTKREVIHKGRGLPLHLCFSCLSPRGLKPCGRCNKCAERDKVASILR